MTEPAIDAVVVTWNNGGLIRACVDSLQRQQGVEMRVTVVDNASNDQSAAEAHRAGVAVVTLPANIGFTRGVQVGLAEGSAPYVLLCNPDCDAESDAVARLVRVLETRSDAGAVVPLLVGVDGKPQRMIYRYPTLSDVFFCFTETGQRLDRRLGSPAQRRYGFAQPPGGVAAPVERPSGAFLLVRRGDAAAFLDETFPIYFSDTELCWQLQALGKTIWCEPAAVVRHVQAASMSQLPGTTILHELQRGLRRFTALHWGRLRRALVDVFLFTDVVLRALARTLRRRSLHAGRAEVGLIRRLLDDQAAPDAPWIEGAAADDAVTQKTVLS